MSSTTSSFFPERYFWTSLYILECEEEWIRLPEWELRFREDPKGTFDTPLHPSDGSIACSIGLRRPGREETRRTDPRQDRIQEE